MVSSIQQFKQVRIIEPKIGGHPWSELDLMIVEPEFDFDGFVVSVIK